MARLVRPKPTSSASSAPSLTIVSSMCITGASAPAIATNSTAVGEVAVRSNAGKRGWVLPDQVFELLMRREVAQWHEREHAGTE